MLHLNISIIIWWNNSWSKNVKIVSHSYLLLLSWNVICLLCANMSKSSSPPPPIGGAALFAVLPPTSSVRIKRGQLSICCKSPFVDSFFQSPKAGSKIPFKFNFEFHSCPFFSRVKYSWKSIVLQINTVLVPIWA